VVAGEAILGANVFKGVFAGIRDLVGGRSATYERARQRARDIAIVVKILLRLLLLVAIVTLTALLLGWRPERVVG
jgi:hypothetical protein